MGNCMSSAHHQPQQVKSFGETKNIPLSQRDTAASNGKAIAEALNSPVNLKIALIAESNNNINTSPRKKNSPRTPRRDNEEEEEEDLLESTMPLTPMSLLSSANPPQSQTDAATSTTAGSSTTDPTISPANNERIPSQVTDTLDGGADHPAIFIKGTDDSDGSDQPFFYSVAEDGTRKELASSLQQSTTQTTANKNTRQGRALQARLQKARYMQMVMAANNTKSELTTSNVEKDNDDGTSPAEPSSSQRSFFMAGERPNEGTSNNNPTDYESESEAASDTEGLLQQMPLQYSTSLPDTKSMISNDEFEASLNQGMIWAEVDCDSQVLAVALSRQVPTLECTTPPLFLAVGTESGTLSVTELMDDASSSSSSSGENYSKARLGSTMTLQRQGRIRALNFSPDGTCFACAGDDGSCALVMVEQDKQDMEDNHDSNAFGKNLRILSEISRLDRIYTVQFSPDGQFLAIGGYDATVAIVDVTSLTAPHIVAEIPVDGLINSLDWNPNGELLAIGGSDKLCTLVDASQNWQILHDLRRPASVSCAEWHPNGRHLAIGSSDVVVVDVETLRVEKEISFQNDDGNDDTMSFTSNMSTGLVSSTSSVASGRQNSAAAKGAVRINDLCWSPGNGNYLVVCANNHRAKLLETKTYSTIQDIRRRANICSVVWGQQNRISNVPHRFLAMGGEDKKVLILKAGLSSQSVGTGSSIGDDTSAASSYFSNRGDWILKEDNFKDLDEGVKNDPVARARPAGEVQKLSGTAKVVSFSRGSKSRPSAFFAVACEDGTVALQSTIGWTVLCRMEFLNPMSCIAFSNGSRILACGADNGKVQIIATAPVWTVATVIDAGAPVTDVCFSKNNERLAIVGNDGFLGLVDPQDNFGLASEMECESIITVVEWSSRSFVVGQEDGTVSIYPVNEVLTQNFDQIEPMTVSRPTPVRSLSFGYRGRLLAVGGDDGVVAIYNTEGKWPMVHSISVDFSVSRVKWSPTGRHLAIAGHNNNLKVVDTVFWAEIEELNKFVSSCRNTGVSVDTSLGFSQDGKFLSFTTNDHSGTRIIRTDTWELVLDLEGELASPIGSSSSSSGVGESFALEPSEITDEPSFHKMSSIEDSLGESLPSQGRETFEEMISQHSSATPFSRPGESDIDSSIQDSSLKGADGGHIEASKSNEDFISRLDALEVAPSIDENAVEQYKLMQLKSESLRASFVADEEEEVGDSLLDPLQTSHGDEATVEEYELPPGTDELPVGSDLFDM